MRDIDVQLFIEKLRPDEKDALLTAFMNVQNVEQVLYQYWNQQEIRVRSIKPKSESLYQQAYGEFYLLQANQNLILSKIIGHNTQIKDIEILMIIAHDRGMTLGEQAVYAFVQLFWHGDMPDSCPQLLLDASEDESIAADIFEKIRNYTPRDYKLACAKHEKLILSDISLLRTVLLDNRMSWTAKGIYMQMIIHDASDDMLEHCVRDDEDAKDRGIAELHKFDEIYG